jgi:DNA-3-methyladenine glycosylase
VTRALPTRFFTRSCLQVAPELLGCLLVRTLASGVQLTARIVEVEAYLGDGSDPASHSHQGLTPRNRTMFGPPGHLYVYRSMGIHACMNAVCEPEGRSSAVLLRAAAPLEGIGAMQAARGRLAATDLCSGPGKLCQAFAVTLDLDGSCMRNGPLRILRGRPPAQRILAGPRIGISRARDLPYRFFLEGDPNVTRSPLNQLATPYARPAPRAVPVASARACVAAALPTSRRDDDALRVADLRSAWRSQRG